MWMTCLFSNISKNRMERNDLEIDDVMIDVNLDGMALDGTNTERYSDPLDAEVEELFLAIASELSSPVRTWDGSEYDFVHLSISNGSHLSLYTELSVP